MKKKKKYWKKTYLAYSLLLKKLLMTIFQMFVNFFPFCYCFEPLKGVRSSADILRREILQRPIRANERYY